MWARDDLELDEPFFWRRGYPALFLLGGEQYVSPRLEQAIASYLRESELATDGDVLVERLSYENPVEVVVVVGALVLAVLRLVRDWPERRRLNRARVGDYENQVETRKQVRKLLVDRLASGQYPLSPEHVDDLLTKDAVDAFRALGDGHVAVRELESPAEEQ